MVAARGFVAAVHFVVKELSGSTAVHTSTVDERQLEASTAFLSRSTFTATTTAATVEMLLLLLLLVRWRRSLKLVVRRMAAAGGSLEDTAVVITSETLLRGVILWKERLQ